MPSGLAASVRLVHLDTEGQLVAPTVFSPLTFAPQTLFFVQRWKPVSFLFDAGVVLVLQLVSHWTLCCEVTEGSGLLLFSLTPWMIFPFYIYFTHTGLFAAIPFANRSSVGWQQQNKTYIFFFLKRELTGACCGR
jgi:hypothetical protein